MTLNRQKRSDVITAYLFLLPAIVLWMIWFFIPAARSFYISFFDYSFVYVAQNKFVGLDNYVDALKNKEFYQALGHSIFLAFIAVPVQGMLALLIAVALNRKLRFKSGFRTIFYTPYVVSTIAVTTVFMSLFKLDAPLTQLFTLFGLENTTWYADLQLALPFITAIYIWQQIGFYIVVFVAGLQVIPAELYESANVDGANGMQKFFRITIPNLKPILFLALSYGMINALQVFDQVAAVAQNSPLGSPVGATSTLVSYFYVQSFKNWNMGYGSAIAVLLFVVIFVITMIQKRLVGNDEESAG